MRMEGFKMEGKVKRASLPNLKTKRHACTIDPVGPTLNSEIVSAADLVRGNPMYGERRFTDYDKKRVLRHDIIHTVIDSWLKSIEVKRGR